MSTLGALSGRTFDAVLLDMDGTLVDSTPAVTRSWRRWAQEEDVDPALLVGRHGVPAAGIVAAVVPERDEGARAAAVRRIEAIEVADTDGVVVLPGAVDALRSLAAGRRSAVVTSSTRPLALARIDAAALPAPAVVVTASDVERGKPDPQPFLLAARHLGVDPRRCLVVEDAPAGLAAGRAAGCATLALSTTHAEAELAGSADAVVADLSAVRFDVDADGAVTVVAAEEHAGAPPVDTAYEDLLRAVMATGTPKGDRTGTGTRSLFGHQLRYDLSRGFPLVTTKRVHLRSVVVELLWFLRGDSNARWLQERGVRIWDAWAGPDGDLGPVYGVQWRSWPTPGGGHVDQLSQVLETLRSDPDSRRMVVSAWNVAELPAMALAPCHALFQLHVADGRLSCQVYQRSADLFLGVPFNIASYALLTHMIAQEVGLGVGDLVWTGGDCHVYDNHVEQVREQLGREPYPFPTLRLRRAASLFEHEVEDVEVVGYRHHPTITAPVAV